MIKDFAKLKEIIEDPVKFHYFCWPNDRLYDRQVEIMYSVRDNDETYVPAANMMGKDYVTARTCLWFFVSRLPARVVTSSVDSYQLEQVLWGEMAFAIQTSKFKLPLDVKHQEINYVMPNGEKHKKAYIIGRVAKKGEGLLGHHLPRTRDWIPRTLAVFDEASGCEDGAYEAVYTWAHRKLIIGNTRPCANFFFRGVKAGDVKAADGKRLYSKVIKIKGEDSPNVKFGMKAVTMGKEPPKYGLVPGLLSYDEYNKRRATLDPVQQSWVLDAEFYEGAETLLYPQDWLNKSENQFDELRKNKTPRVAEAMGVDTAEGGDDSAWTVVDKHGIIEQEAFKTIDTSVISSKTLQLMRKHKLSPEAVFFDRGGGGKQHVDYLRLQGYGGIQTVSFGIVADQNPYKKGKQTTEKKDLLEVRYAFKSQRVRMYWLLRELLDPTLNENTFAIPRSMFELRRQLAPLPYFYDGEGRLFMPPKDRSQNKNYEGATIKEILGRSPDHADSLVLGIYGMKNKVVKRTLRAVI